MPDYDRGPVTHYLVYRGKVEDDDYDFDVKHDPDRCPHSLTDSGATFWECGVGWQLNDIGADAFGVWQNPLDDTHPGTYVLLDWYETYPGGPWGLTSPAATATSSTRRARTPRPRRTSSATTAGGSSTTASRSRVRRTA